MFNFFFSFLHSCAHKPGCSTDVQWKGGRPQVMRAAPSLLHLFFLFFLQYSIYKSGNTHTSLHVGDSAPFLSISIAHQLLQELVFVYKPMFTIFNQNFRAYVLLFPSLFKTEAIKNFLFPVVGMLTNILTYDGLSTYWATLSFCQLFLRVTSVKILHLQTA